MATGRRRRPPHGWDRLKEQVELGQIDRKEEGLRGRGTIAAEAQG